MTYVSPATGRQYVLVTIPGAGRPTEPSAHDVSQEAPLKVQGGKVIAYALPN